MDIGTLNLQALFDVQTTNYLVAMATTLIIFDHTITIEQEVNLVWRAPWNLTSLLYIWVAFVQGSPSTDSWTKMINIQNRYYTLIVFMVGLSYIFPTIDSDKMLQISHDSQTPQFKSISSTVLVNTIDIILAFRVWILYEKSQKLLWFLVTLISMELISMTVLGAVAVSTMPTYLHLGPPILGCWPAGSNFDPSHLYYYYTTPTIIVSFIMFLMTVYRCLFRNQMRTPIFSLFLRDGVFWFLAVILVLVPEIVTAASAQHSRVLSQLMNMPTLAVYSLIGSRVLLNIQSLLATNEVSKTVDAHGTFGDHTTQFRAATRHTDYTTDMENELSPSRA